MKKFAMVFPGQGSQSVGMMAGWDDHPVVRETFAEASDALGDDLWRLVTDGPADALNLTTNTQPVMLTAGVAVWRAWQAAGGTMPAVLAGHSLGEYSALVAGGALAFHDAVPLVRFRAQAMQDAVPAGVGAMAAILGGDDAAIVEACREAAQGEVVEAVNFNSPGQLVIAGHRAAVERAIEAAKARGAKRGMLLPVSAPFHSSLLKPAAERLAAKLATVAFGAPAIPILHNVDVVRAPHARCDPRRAGAAGGEPRAMDRDGAGDRRPRRSPYVVEAGPGRVLAGPRAQDRRDAQGPRARRRPRAGRGDGRRRLTEDRRWRRSSTDRWRSSRARRAASVARSRSRSRATARRSSAPRRPTPGAAAIDAALKEGGHAGAGIRLDVTDAAATDAALADVEARFGAGRDPRQQRRHHEGQPRSSG